MQNVQTLKLSRATLMFPLALVLFEFSVYIGNDLVQPAMLAITQDFGWCIKKYAEKKQIEF